MLIADISEDISTINANVKATYKESTNTVEITGLGKMSKISYWSFIDKIANQYNKVINDFIRGYDINISIQDGVTLPTDSSALFGSYAERDKKQILGEIYIYPSIDTRIANYSNDKIYFDTSLGHSFMDKIYSILSNDKIASKSVIGSLKFGFNLDVINNLKLGAFAEYEYNGMHNIGVGAMYNYILENNMNANGFLRYRNVFLDNLKTHNIDLYNRFSYLYNDKFYAKINTSVLLSYGSSTNIDIDTILEKRLVIRADVSTKLGYEIKNTLIFIEPKMNLKYIAPYNIQNTVTKEKIKVSPNILFGSVELGAEHKFNNFMISESILFNILGVLKGNMGFSYNF